PRMLCGPKSGSLSASTCWWRSSRNTASSLQRGRRWTLQESFTKPMARRTVDVGSIVTLLSSGGGGAFTLVHSSMMLCAVALSCRKRGNKASSEYDGLWTFTKVLHAVLPSVPVSIALGRSFSLGDGSSERP